MLTENEERRLAKVEKEVNNLDIALVILFLFMLCIGVSVTVDYVTLHRELKNAHANTNAGTHVDANARAQVWSNRAPTTEFVYGVAKVDRVFIPYATHRTSRTPIVFARTEKGVVHCAATLAESAAPRALSCTAGYDTQGDVAVTWTKEFTGEVVIIP
jgi:hypothetical protein